MKDTEERIVSRKERMHCQESEILNRVRPSHFVTAEQSPPYYTASVKAHESIKYTTAARIELVEIHDPLLDYLQDFASDMSNLSSLHDITSLTSLDVFDILLNWATLNFFARSFIFVILSV
jgi:hypothetical protein